MSSKREFREAIRDLDPAAVARVLQERPELAAAVDREGWTPLHSCARVLAPGGDPGREAVAICRMLLDAGADVNAVRTIPDGGALFEASPLWYAVAQGRNAGVVDLLLERGARPDGCGWAVCALGDVDTLAKLHRAGLDLDAIWAGRTVLMESVRGRRTAVVAWLLAHGAAVDAVDEEGRTALMHGVQARVPTAHLAPLLAAGAAAERPDATGQTPLGTAIAQGRGGVARFLQGGSA